MALREMLELYFRRYKRYDLNYLSLRRLFITLIVVCIILLYLRPLLFRWLWSSSVVDSEGNVQCVEQFLRPYLSENENLDTHIFRSYEDTTNGPLRHFLPYVANGKFGISLDGDNEISIMGKRVLDQYIPYHPLVNIDWIDGSSESAFVIRFKDGTVTKITCFDYLQKSASVVQTFYAHRTLPNLFVQEMKISNPSNAPLIIKLRRIGWTGKQEAKSQHLVVSQREQMDYSLLIGQYELSRNQHIAVGIAAPDVQETLEVNSHSHKILTFKTFINYSSVFPSQQLSGKIPELKSTLRESSKKILDLSSALLQRYHIETWNNLWSTGFSYSYSKAPGALNGDVINATIYYVLSQRPIYKKDNGLGNLSDLDPSKMILTADPDRCYNGHSTLQASTLWSNLDSINDIYRITSLWILTLEKQGCHKLVEAGAEGIMQALVLSIGALQFSHHHLEFNTHPKELHRNYYIRRIMYGNMTRINITVTLTGENKAQIFVVLDQNTLQKDFYACDGGCLDPPKRLSKTPIDFPVKQTEPLTAILYVTSDKQHIEELKHTIHVHEVKEAPAYEHHQIVLHQYGHQLGGLPAIFWISIVFLIVIFHLFLGKLIYNEYCGGGAVQYERNRQGRYAM